MFDSIISRDIDTIILAEYISVVNSYFLLSVYGVGCWLARELRADANSL